MYIYTMKKNIILAVLTGLILLGCANPSKIHQRSVNRGYVHDTTSVVVKVVDTLKINGKDSIVERLVKVDCPEFEAQPTRYELRYQYKALRDTLRLIKYQTKWKVKEVVKTKRIEGKVSLWQWLKIFIWGLVAGSLVFFIKYFINQN